jgi:hypothetical protein
MKIKTAILFVLFLTGFMQSASARYADEIAVSQDEVWKAAKEALKPFGLRKVDEGKHTLETNWIHDKVKRRNRLLKNIPNLEYDRRYRMKIKFQDRAGDTLVEINGVFQQRYPHHEQKTWQTVKPEIEDMDLEQEIFMKILNQLAHSRNEFA